MVYLKQLCQYCLLNEMEVMKEETGLIGVVLVRILGGTYREI